MSSSSKIFHLVQDRQGLRETYQEIQDGPVFCILCDALYPTEPEKNPEIAKDFERVIKKYLWMQKPHLNEKTLLKAFDQAQKHFFKNYAIDNKQLKLSALVIIQPEPGEDKDDSFLYVLGLGDFKLFQIDKPTTLLFYDPETPKLPLNLSLKKRFQCLKNAIGQNTIKASVQRVPLKSIQSLLLISYGTYSLIPEDKWIQYALDFENKKSQILRSLSRSKEKEHLKHFLYLSIQPENTQSKKTVPKRPFEIQTESKNRFKKALYIFNWSLKIALVVVLGLCILELTQNVSIHVSHPTHAILSLPRKKPEMSLNIKAPKKFFRAPLLKERTHLMDIKEKNERQAVVIEKLNEIIKEQDKALRDLQVKKLYSNSSPPTHFPGPISDSNLE